MGPKIKCLFYADDGLILAKDKEKAERSIEIIREIGGKYMASNHGILNIEYTMSTPCVQLNERKSHCILFNTKEKGKNK